MAANCSLPAYYHVAATLGIIPLDRRLFTAGIVATAAVFIMV